MNNNLIKHTLTATDSSIRTIAENYRVVISKVTVTAVIS